MILRNIETSAPPVKSIQNGEHKVNNSAITSGQPEVSNNDDKKGSQALSNYFRAGQMVAFKGHACTKSDFKVKREEGIPCACCGRMMMTNKGVQAFESKAVMLTVNTYKIFLTQIWNILEVQKKQL